WWGLGVLGGADAKAHFEKHGRAEGRFGSALDLFKASGMSIRDLPISFSVEEYVHFNPDLARLGSGFLQLLGHYLVWGWKKEGRTYGRWQLYLDSLELSVPTTGAPLAVSTDAARVDVCVVMHLFYLDLWPELAAFARNFDSASRDVFVNVVDISWSPQFHRQLRELCPGAFIQLSNDDGRDIGGFMRLFDN